MDFDDFQVPGYDSSVDQHTDWMDIDLQPELTQETSDHLHDSTSMVCVNVNFGHLNSYISCAFSKPLFELKKHTLDEFEFGSPLLLSRNFVEMLPDQIFLIFRPKI